MPQPSPGITGRQGFSEAGALWHSRNLRTQPAYQLARQSGISRVGHKPYRTAMAVPKGDVCLLRMTGLTTSRLAPKTSSKPRRSNTPATHLPPAYLLYASCLPRSYIRLWPRWSLACRSVLVERPDGRLRRQPRRGRNYERAGLASGKKATGVKCIALNVHSES